MNKWDAIREHYARHRDEIVDSASYEWGIDAYEWERCPEIVMTPIEAALWQDIRSVGAVFYPQFPVGRFFVDFGNPVACVAIECDGAAYHKDIDRDDVRQREIEAHGWRVYRLTGRECFTDTRETQDEIGRTVATTGFARRYLEEIARKHRLAWPHD